MGRWRGADRTDTMESADRDLDPPALADEFRERGFFVVPGFLSRDEASAMLAEVERCARDDEETSSLSSGGLLYSGAIFLRSQTVREVLSSQRLVDLLTALAEDDVWVVMDQAVTKEPGAGAFRWHQDNGYNRLKREHFQVWIALTRTEKANGALQLVPGSHARGLLPHSYAGEGQMEFTGELGEIVTVDATAGDLIVFSSLMLHHTPPNVADTTRVAYVAEFMATRDYAPASAPPYWIVSEGGRSAPRFTDTKPGARSLRNQMLYLAPRVKSAVKKPLRAARDTVRRLVGRTAPS